MGNMIYLTHTEISLDWYEFDRQKNIFLKISILVIYKFNGQLAKNIFFWKMNI